MVDLEVKKNKGNYEVNLFYNKHSKSHYSNTITRDPNRIAQILIDLYMEGFPIEKAIKLYNQRIKKRDWLGI